MKSLNIGTIVSTGKPFTLPPDYVTKSVAILAQKRVGKSYTAAVITEELLENNLLPVVIDYTGAHWGLKSSADGKKAGYPVVVFGGDNADIPLEQNSGEVVAQSIVENRFPAIIDLTTFRKAEALRFLGPFFETIYRLNRQPLHLICDEADAYAPQKPFGEEARVLGAMQDIVRRGGIRGIGSTLITQRPAVLSKDVLTQCEMLIAMRMMHPRDINAIEEWIAVHATAKEAAKLKESLPSLPKGTAWFWSPGWGDIFELVAVRSRRTFDSGKTPEAGAVAVPTKLAEVDVAKLGESIAATVKRAHENKPETLRARIAQLERELKQKPVASAVAPERVEVRIPILSDEQMREFTVISARLGKLEELISNQDAALRECAVELRTLRSELAVKLRSFEKPHASGPRPQLPAASREAPRHRNPEPVRSSAGIDSNGTLTKGARTILIAIAQHEGDGCTREQLSVLTGYKRSSRDTYLQQLSSGGFIEPAEDRLVSTTRGVRELGSNFEPLPTGAALRDYWLNRLTGGERLILERAVERYPDDLDRDAITEFKRSSRDTFIQRLMARRLVDRSSPGFIIANANLF